MKDLAIKEAEAKAKKAKDAKNAKDAESEEEDNWDKSSADEDSDLEIDDQSESSDNDEDDESDDDEDEESSEDEKDGKRRGVINYRIFVSTNFTFLFIFYICITFSDKIAINNFLHVPSY